MKNNKYWSIIKNSYISLVIRSSLTLLVGLTLLIEPESIPILSIRLFGIAWVLASIAYFLDMIAKYFRDKSNS